MANDCPVAFVTGASRGIGKAGALALADAGYDVVVTARTLRRGESYDYAATVADSGDPVALPGSVEETAIEVEKRGQRALPLRLDLLDRASLDEALDRTLAEWGRIDVLYNNGIYQGAGVMDSLMDLPEEKLALVFEGNVFAQFHLTRRVLDSMLRRGEGTIVNMTSNAGQFDPPHKPGEGAGDSHTARPRVRFIEWRARFTSNSTSAESAHTISTPVMSRPKRKGQSWARTAPSISGTASRARRPKCRLRCWSGFSPPRKVAAEAARRFTRRPS
ncbi:MAG: SDR family NAD(P)-dependent oxidoreductase [Proteobacteria bacterium]|nr:SDR family NAD(P)-dependent oxidoreductase [Pseudomonadota bacterium]